MIEGVEPCRTAGIAAAFGIADRSRHLAARFRLSTLARRAAVLGFSVIAAFAGFGDVALAARLDVKGLKAELDPALAAFDGRVGVCVGAIGDRPACWRPNERFPMQSVVKLVVALAVLDAVDAGRWHLDDPVVVKKEDLSVNVQPIAKLVTDEGFHTTLGDLLRRMVVSSDSAANDILMRRLGGPRSVQAFLARKGIHGIYVDRDEKHLQTEVVGLNWRLAYLDPTVLDRAVASVPQSTRRTAIDLYLASRRDTATPLAMTVLLQSLAGGKLLSPQLTAYLLDVLRQTTTFPDRLKAGLAANWSIGHKTGTARALDEMTPAFNDVGILTAPGGSTLAVSVFLSGSHLSAKSQSALIAEVAHAVTANWHEN